MRSRWYLVIVVWMGLLCGAGVAGVAPAESQGRWVAQADSETGEMPDIVAGPQNPQMTLEINGGIAGLTALQVTVTTPQQRHLMIDTVAIGFGLPFGEDTTTGNEALLDELHARLIIEDVEVNGRQDEGEVSEGTQSVTDLEEPTTVVFGLDPPRLLEAGTAATFLVIVDINRPATQSATAMPFPPAAMLLLLPSIGFVAYACRALLQWHGIFFFLAVLVLSGGLTLVGCSGGDDDDELRFVVNLPSNGLSGAGQRLGPTSAIAGTTIRLMR